MAYEVQLLARDRWLTGPTLTSVLALIEDEKDEREIVIKQNGRVLGTTTVGHVRQAARSEVKLSGAIG